MLHELFKNEQKSAELLAFEYFLRTGVRLAPDAIDAYREKKFNQNHDPHNGQFTFGMGSHGPVGTSTPAGNRSSAPQLRAAKPLTPARPGPKPSEPAARRHPGFTNDIIAAAQESNRQTGIPASITLAQFGLESGYGRHMPPGSNNPFGIKARPGEPFVEQATWEQDRSGRKYLVKARFRKYGSLAEAFADHARVLQNPAYAHARAARSSAEFADRLTGVYATDHQYGAKLKSVIHHNNLDSFNIP